jgi:ribosomal protein L11 methyltransferase
VALDPGMAFGTGLHPTTRLCLAGLERWADAGLVGGARVLDIGCGSGILAVSAGLLGAGALRAVDTDPIAVEATRENAARNGVDVDVTVGSVPIAGGPWDLILANLVASLLVALAPELAAALRPGDSGPDTAAGGQGAAGADQGTAGADQGTAAGAPRRGGRLLASRGGRLLASGIFVDREAEVVDAFESVGLRIVGREQETDWVALDVERAGSSPEAAGLPAKA